MTASALVSLLTATLVLAAFRLPSYMMFRGLRSPLALRRPVMVIRAPMARSAPIANSRVETASNFSTTTPSNPPQLHPILARPQLWPFPGPIVPPMPYPLPKIESHDQESLQLSAVQIEPTIELMAPNNQIRTQESRPLVKPFFPPNHSMNYKELKGINSMNNRPFYYSIHKFDEMTTSQTQLYDEHFNRVFRPSNGNKYKKKFKEYNERKTTVIPYNSLNSNSGNEEVKYGLMYPMPRNYQNHQMESQTHQTIINVKQTPKVTEEVKQTTTPTLPTTSQKPRIMTKIWVKPSIKSNDTKNSSPMENLLYYESLRQTHSMPTSSLKPTLKSIKYRYRVNKTRLKPMTTTTELSTVMTPAPIENYKPVKARINGNHKENGDDFNRRLMFDDSKNLYYYIPLKN